MHSIPQFSLRTLFSVTFVAAILAGAITREGRVTALAFAIVAAAYLIASQSKPFPWIVPCGAWCLGVGMIIGQTFEPGPFIWHFEITPTRTQYSTTGAVIGLCAFSVVWICRRLPFLNRLPVICAVGAFAGFAAWWIHSSQAMLSIQLPVVGFVLWTGSLFGIAAIAGVTRRPT